jgi:hypothetical protein
VDLSHQRLWIQGISFCPKDQRRCEYLSEKVSRGLRITADRPGAEQRHLGHRSEQRIEVSEITGSSDEAKSRSEPMKVPYRDGISSPRERARCKPYERDRCSKTTT